MRRARPRCHEAAEPSPFTVTFVKRVVSRNHRDVVVRVQDVRALDTAATQVLLCLRRALAAQGRALRMEGAPPRIAERWRRAGLDDLFAEPRTADRDEGGGVSVTRFR